MKIKNIYKLAPILTFLLIAGCDTTSSESTPIELTETAEATTLQIEQETSALEVNPVKPMPTIPRPSSGLYTENLNGQQAIAPLEIRTDSGSDYYVKVVNAANDNDTLAIYIHGGETVEVEVPLGSYEIRYASGNDWYGEKGLFGIETSYNKADELFTFSDTGYQISGYTITLYQVANGNLQTKSIDESQF